MAGRRIERLNEQVKREVADIVNTKVKDPRVGTVTVTEARVSRDLSVATIYVLPSGADAEQKETLAGLAAAAPFIRSELGERLRLRKLPALRFIRDETIAHATRIERLLHEVLPPARPATDATPPEDPAPPDPDDE